MSISVTWDDSDNEHDNNESHTQVVDNENYIAYPVFLNCGNNNFDVFELENSDENQSNQEQDEFDDPNLENLYAQALAKFIKLCKRNKVLKDQVDTLTCDLQNKIESTSHKIEVLENEKQGLHDKALFLEKEVNDAKENMKSALDELCSAKLDVVLSQQKLEKFCHGAKNIDKMLYMGKKDSDKRGQGYDEPLTNAKTPQSPKFVKASTSVPKHNMISTTHNHAKRCAGITKDRCLVDGCSVIWVSALSRGYPSSVSVHGATTAGLTLNRTCGIQDLELRREIGARRCEDVGSCKNGELIAGSSIIREVTTGCAYRIYNLAVLKFEGSLKFLVGSDGWDLILKPRRDLSGLNNPRLTIDGFKTIGFEIDHKFSDLIVATVAMKCSSDVNWIDWTTPRFPLRTKTDLDKFEMAKRIKIIRLVSNPLMSSMLMNFSFFSPMYEQTDVKDGMNYVVERMVHPSEMDDFAAELSKVVYYPFSANDEKGSSKIHVQYDVAQIKMINEESDNTLEDLIYTRLNTMMMADYTDFEIQDTYCVVYLENTIYPYEVSRIAEKTPWPPWFEGFGLLLES
ncbi:hypothetical protein GIB67_004207 [Kingdonia uniflora]|uniref:Uncharacterized protein n=1 Tax=Kingdonia uniflora TaxID=39325 RepID=A0A7J7P1N9_9MAGN|nr:hypothetical protein GIB67_004207 [Kingdonia uniflora]